MAQVSVAKHQQSPITDTGDVALLSEIIAEGGCPCCGKLSVTLLTPVRNQPVRFQCGSCGWRLNEPSPLEVGELTKITQAMLIELHQLSVLGRRRKALRREIIAAIDAGASIAAGPLNVELTEYSRQSPTWGNITEHLGEDAVAILRASILPKSQSFLKVVPSRDHLMLAQNLRPQDVVGQPRGYIQ